MYTELKGCLNISLSHHIHIALQQKAIYYCEWETALYKALSMNYEIYLPVAHMIYVTVPQPFVCLLKVWSWKKYGRGYFLFTPRIICKLYFSVLPSELWTIITSLAVYGLFIGCAVVPTFACMVIGAKWVYFIAHLLACLCFLLLFMDVSCQNSSFLYHMIYPPSNK